MTSPANVRLEEAVRWLIHEKNRREFEILCFLQKGPFTAVQLKALAEIQHDAQLHRSLEYLNDYGLLDSFFDASVNRRGHLYQASPIGRRAYELSQRVEEFLHRQLKA